MKEQKRLVKGIVLLALILFGGFTIISSGGGGGGSDTPAPADNLNLIFVVSPDLANNAPGDIDPGTANLTNQGLHRSLLMSTYLKQQVLGSKNVTAIYALEPMTHLQTASNYPDMAALVTIQQFALLNQITLDASPGNSYPLNVSYASGAVPGGVATPSPVCQNCQGLVFNDVSGNNVALVDRIVKANVPGFHVFSAPWETISRLLADINTLKGYNLTLPAAYMGPNYIYQISIAPSGSASLVTIDSKLNPSPTYPVLPAPPIVNASCPSANTIPKLFTITKTFAGIPANINKNETVYFVRHAEAHPTSSWEDGNYVGAGQWRALALPNALSGKISPDQVYSIDPAQVIPGSTSASGNSNWSYVRPSLTVAPYAIANNLPYNLVSGIEILAWNSPRLTSDFFFKNGTFDNQTLLVAWEHDHIPWIVDELLWSYGVLTVAPDWPSADYDTIWTVTLDGSGNVTVNNALCEGIASAALPATAPQF
jgi:hypothetical protein